jgi:hypothetical protein
MVRATTASGRSSNASSNNNAGATMAANAATASLSQSLTGVGWGNNNSSSKHNSKAGAAASAASTSGADPTFLLSRGYTSRFLLGTTIPSHAGGNGGSNGSNSGNGVVNKSASDSGNNTTTTSFSLLQALTPDEIDKDLRHMQAYGAAVLQYQQQYYWQTNQAAGRPVSARPVMTDVGLTSDIVGSAGVVPAGAGSAGGAAGMLPGGSLPPGGAGAGAGPPAIITSLPVRIDPEEEKRLLTLRSKIQKAEILREQAEQEYVAYRAHYVGQQHCLVQQTADSKAVLQWLQALTVQRAATVSLQRVRLEMTRNVHAALLLRSNVLQEPAELAATFGGGGSSGTAPTGGGGASGTADAVGGAAVSASAAPSSNTEMDISNNFSSATTTATTTTKSTSPTPGTVTPVAAHATRSTDVDEMMAAYNQIEDDFKAAVIACRQISSSSTAVATTTGSGKSKASKKDAVLSWKATKLTATPTNVPLLLSAVSTVPEKSLAWKCGGVFGSKPESLAWMESHLPAPDQIPVAVTTNTTSDTTAAAQMANKTVDTDTDQVEALREELQFIGRELDKERDSSKSYAHKIAQLRTQNDEWVAMMGLIRQETESVLHRHHILLESDMAMQASERLHHEHEEERIADETSHKEEEEEEAVEPLVQPVPQQDGDAVQVPLQAPLNAEDAGVPTVVAAVDEANDGDDEDSNDDDDEELQGNTANWETGKRPADDLECDTSPAERKRRKL